MIRFETALVRLGADLQALNLRWCLVGGLAVSARTEPRTTRDIDVAVVVSGDRQAELVAFALKDRGYREHPTYPIFEREDTDRLVTARLLMPGGREGVVKVDLLFASSGVEEEVVAAAEDLEFTPGAFVPVARAEHLLALKVLAGRPKDHEDGRALLRRMDERSLLRAREAIADALRDQQPAVVVVDDAHVHPDHLAALVRLRREIEGDFSILATTWEGGPEEVVEALGGDVQVHKLELLPRREIMEIFEQAGVAADSEVLRELVDQAANKPGLAVTIAHLWLQGAWQEVLDGSVLRRTLLAFFTAVIGEESIPVLAAFSLGGKEGMSLQAVSEALGLSLVEVYRIATGLAAGGVLSEVDGKGLAISPRVLRSALIREAVLPQAGPKLPLERLLGGASSLDCAVEELVRAKGYGAKVPDDRLRALVMQAGSRRTWAELASLGEHDARWALESYGGEVLDIAGAALGVAPRAAIPRLLARAAEAGGSRIREPSAMSLLARWVRDIRVPNNEKLERRRLLAGLSADFLRQGGDRGTGVHGICLALSPGLEGSSLDPGAGQTVTISASLLRRPLLEEIPAIWDAARAAIGALDAPSWLHLKSALWDWIYPQHAARRTDVPEDTRLFMRGFAEKVLRDLVPLAAGSPGLVSGMRELAGELGVPLPLAADADFEAVFPPQGAGADDAARDAARLALEELAARWLAKGPGDVAAKLAEYEHEARRAGRQWSSRKGALGRALADASDEPEIWLATLLDAGASSHFVQPFLERVGREHRTGWKHLLGQALAQEEYAWIASEVTLQLEAPPATLLERVHDLAGRVPQLVENLCARREVPLATLQALLLHSNRAVALAAAVGEWHAAGRTSVRSEVVDPWRRAILRAASGERNTGLQFWLGIILGNDSALARDWLSARLQETEAFHLVTQDGPFGRAVSALDQAQRLRFLEEHENLPFPRDLVRLLVGSDADLYRHLLSLQGLADRHLEPLGGMPEGAWLDLAKAALAAGFDAHEVAAAALCISHTTVGSGLSYWSRWDDAFARLEGTEAGLREVGRQGREIVAEDIERAAARDRKFALEGLGAA